MRRVVRAIDGQLGSPDHVRRVREMLARVDRAVVGALDAD
jgi:hypothetical protein